MHAELVFFFFLKSLFIFRQRGREGEREGEKHQCVVASHKPPTRDLARNPGMCPDWESNRGPFGSQARAQSTELHQPGLSWVLILERMGHLHLGMGSGRGGHLLFNDRAWLVWRHLNNSLGVICF